MAGIPRPVTQIPPFVMVSNYNEQDLVLTVLHEFVIHEGTH